LCWPLQRWLQKPLDGHRSINAVVENFCGTLKKELSYRRSWPTRNEVAAAVHEYIGVFYNRRRRHTANGRKSPAAHEALAKQELTQAA